MVSIPVAVRANTWRLLISAMPDDLTKEKLDRYREAWGQPGAITGMHRKSLVRRLKGRLESKERSREREETYGADGDVALTADQWVLAGF